MSAIAEKGAKSPPTAGAARAETRHPKSARLQARLSPKQQELLARAAALEGRTLSQFVLTHAQAAAQKTIAEHRALALSAQDSRAFAEALLAPWSPDEELRDTIRRMRDTFDQQGA
ncbi:MAG TPA: DUF1778 domain-containing protein [Chloroflexota bacterium]|nr:DUF1778 domain-containing protein [Chloroflexota bacterium]